MDGRGAAVPPQANAGESLLQLIGKPPVSHPSTLLPRQQLSQTFSNKSAVLPQASAGEFLLQLIGKPPVSHPSIVLPHQELSKPFSDDAAVAAVGPAVPTFWPNGQWDHSSSSSFAPQNYFPQNHNANPTLNPGFSYFPGGFNYAPNQCSIQSHGVSLDNDGRISGFPAENSKPSVANQPELNITFGSFGAAGNVLHGGLCQGSRVENLYLGDSMGMDGRLNGFQMNSVAINGKPRGNSSISMGYGQERNYDRDIRGKPWQNGNWNYGNGSTSDHNVNKGNDNFGYLDNNNIKLSNQLDPPGPPAGSTLHSVSASALELHGENGDNAKELGDGGQCKISRDGEWSELPNLGAQIMAARRLKDEADEKSDENKEYRSDKQGHWIMCQSLRNLKRQISCRSDIDWHNAPFLAVFESLIPANKEKIKQEQLLTVMETLVTKEWPEARLYLFGSRANSFGFSESDMDMCLVIKNENIDKCKVLLKLADMLQSDNFQNVQALTHARVPIVKFNDPVTGISCDICINTMLALVNTKLLQDYAEIDVRLRQLVFIVKHWAKSRRINETYQGTLSSYAYVLMCIHFLQQRRPAILPCLQRMRTTYFETVDNIECSYFDQVENLRNFGARNRETIAQLVWGFFHYWAHCHNYADDVISVRTGATLSKRDKGWTRRIGNDRHLICIEDPFEVSHDLGRVVDKDSIRVLREEFQRAAAIMEDHLYPFVALFEPYIPYEFF